MAFFLKKRSELVIIISFLIITASQNFFLPVSAVTHVGEGRITQKKPNPRKVIEIEGDPNGVVWVVQLSDLHFSRYHSERAEDFSRIIGPALALIKPSLVLITGDLTDGKSRDLLTMKQDRMEWMEYNKVLKDVMAKSGLPEHVFYDLKGNHDNFGVPILGGEYDYFLNYSVGASSHANARVYSVTLQNSGWKHLFVGLDSTMDIGLRGPTNLFGHPTDQLLEEVEEELMQWDDDFVSSVTKIAFGHYPLSFTAATESKRKLRDVFLENHLSVYLCGHLHTKFGKNLKRHHQQADRSFMSLNEYFQWNGQHSTSGSTDMDYCSSETSKTKEFWEWEMGDWRKSRAMRILAIDQGHISFLDVDYQFTNKKILIVPTFPLDSRTMQTISSFHDYNCQYIRSRSYEAIRALVFSNDRIIGVLVRIYDKKPGDLSLVLEERMEEVRSVQSRGKLYVAKWNWRAFADDMPDRYWLEIEVIDFLGSSTLSQMRPFSINGRAARLRWTWKEFLALGCMWGYFYYFLLYFTLVALFSMLLVPKIFLSLQVHSSDLRRMSNFGSVWKYLADAAFGAFWMLQELSRMSVLWSTFLVYLVYTVLFPWFSGEVLTDKGSLGYMRLNGWTVEIPGTGRKQTQLAVPDVMVLILPYYGFVVFPTILVAAALAAEKALYHAHCRSRCGKKSDDGCTEDSKPCGTLFIRKVMVLVCLVILWRHWKHCRAVMKAYDSSPFSHALVHCWSIPLLMVLSFYNTSLRKAKQG